MTFPIDPKSAADRQHDRLIGDITSRDNRSYVTIKLPRADLHRAARSLDARAEALLVRRDRDPILREAANREAGHCRRLSFLIADAIREGGR